jgi:IclR family pca regulon transcriptional regulator
MALMHDEDGDDAVTAAGGGRDHVTALARGLAVITSFSRDRPRMTLTDVARATGISRATARRCLLTLVDEGYADRAGALFFLKPKVLDLGYSALSSSGLADAAQSVMDSIARLTGETLFLTVLSGTHVTCIGGAAPPRLVNVTVDIGRRLPVHLTAAGRVLLAAERPAPRARVLERLELAATTPHSITSMAALAAAIDQAGRQGWALVDQELETGLAQIAVPVRAANGDAVAAISTACPTARVDTATMQARLLPLLQAAAARITAAL